MSESSKPGSKGLTKFWFTLQITILLSVFVHGGGVILPTRTCYPYTWCWNTNCQVLHWVNFIFQKFSLKHISLPNIVNKKSAQFVKNDEN